SIGIDAAELSLDAIGGSLSPAKGGTGQDTSNSTANTVLAAPSGTSGPPTMRALVPADIPTLTVAKISDFSTSVAAASVSKAGDTMTGALGLPANGLTVGTNQIVTYEGNVGIGVSQPDAKLEIAG